MKVGYTTGYKEEFWAGWPFNNGQYGGTENMLIETAVALAEQGHEVTVRLPRNEQESMWRGVRWIGDDAPSQSYDVLFSYDDFAVKDKATRTMLYNCRSDPPKHTDFDRIVFFSKHQARVLGHPECDGLGGGVSLGAYARRLPRLARRVICTSSPDRCPHATLIGRDFDFVQTYKPVGGIGREYTRADLIELQLTAKVQIYPLDPRRPSDFFSMSVLEAMAAGTPVIVSDADSMPELWASAALMLPRPIDFGQWYEETERMLTDRCQWRKHSEAGLALAKQYDWPLVAKRHLEAALA